MLVAQLNRFGFVLLLCLSAAVNAEPLSPERAFSDPPISGEKMSALKISPDGRWVSYVTPTDTGAVLWVIPASGGPARKILDTRSLGQSKQGLTPEQLSIIQRRHNAGVDALDYWWSEDGRQFLLDCNNDLYLQPLDGDSAKRVVVGESVLGDPQLAPDARSISFTRDKQLVIYEVSNGRETVIGENAGGNIYYGTPDFITQEELQRFTAIWWSPDSARIAYTRTDESRVTIVPHIGPDTERMDIVSSRFPLAGTDNSDVRLYVRELNGTNTVSVDLGPDRDIYLYQVSWSVDGKTLYAERQSRDQKRLDLLAIDPRTGKSRVVLSETSNTWVDLGREFRPLRDGGFLWGSSRTGWEHLYLYDKSGHVVRAVTRGAWRVASIDVSDVPDQSPIVAVDEDKKLLYFISSKDTPLEQHLYKISYSHDDEPHQITRGHGWWVVAMAGRNPASFVGRYSEPDLPPQTALYGLTGQRIAWLEENRLDNSHPMFSFMDHRPSCEFGSIKSADGQDLWYMLVKPAHFDPSKRYPAIVRAYGGPGVQTVRREWHSLIDQLLSQEGYVLFRLDNRGSTNRSVAFEHALYGHIGEPSNADQLLGVKFLASLPFIDSDRIGMTGWSFGGYVSARAVMTPGSGVRAAAAGATVSNYLLYDTYYTERFLGNPATNVAAYEEANLLNYAKNLNGRLLLMHGISDDNVSFVHYIALAQALEQRGKTFDTALFPSQSHVLIGTAAEVRAFKTTVDFFGRALAPRAPTTQE